MQSGRITQTYKYTRIVSVDPAGAWTYYDSPDTYVYGGQYYYNLVIVVTLQGCFDGHHFRRIRTMNFSRRFDSLYRGFIALRYTVGRESQLDLKALHGDKGYDYPVMHRSQRELQAPNCGTTQV